MLHAQFEFPVHGSTGDTCVFLDLVLWFEGSSDGHSSTSGAIVVKIVLWCDPIGSDLSRIVKIAPGSHGKLWIVLQSNSDTRRMCMVTSRWQQIHTLLPH
jgi:hypothetical protein